MPEATAQYRLAIGLQGALTQAEVTRAYLHNAPQLIGARGRGFYQLDPLSGAPSTVAADVSAEFLQDYEERGRQGDPVLDFVRTHFRPVDDTGACPVRDWERSPVHDVLRQAGFYHSLEAPVAASGTFIGTINFARARGDRPFSPADIAAAQTAAEQVGLAVERAQRFEQTGVRASMLEAALDRLPQAVVLTDSQGEVLYANRAATRPHFPGGSLLEHAAPRMAQDLASFSYGTKRVLVGSGSPGGKPRAGRAGPADRVVDRVTVKSVQLPGDRGVMMTLIYPAAGGAGQLPLWDILTPREQQIADWVSQGLTTRQIAERAVVTENTVKQHLKRIFVKADVTNRAELVQRIWTARRAAP